MTNNDLNQTSGENRHKARRRKMIRYLTIAFLGFALVGFMGGYVESNYSDGTLPLWVPLTLLAVVVIALIWFTWDFFRRVDELELLDNLWAHLIGQYAAILVFMVWYFLADLKLVEYPTAFAIVVAMVTGTMLAYGARKLGLR